MENLQTWEPGTDGAKSELYVAVAEVGWNAWLHHSTKMPYDKLDAR
jgi:hypothetical protein